MRDSSLVRVEALAEARHLRSSTPAVPRVAEPGSRGALAMHLESVLEQEEEELAMEMSLTTIREVVVTVFYSARAVDCNKKGSDQAQSTLQIN